MQLNIDFNALAESGRVEARRSAAFISMGQKAWADETIKSATVEAPFSIRLLPDPMPDELGKEVRRKFRLWVIGNAITEIVQALSRLVDQFFEIWRWFRITSSLCRWMHSIVSGNAKWTRTYIQNLSGPKDWD